MPGENSPNNSLYRQNTVNNWMIVQEEPGGSSVVVHAPLEEEIGEMRPLTRSFQSPSMFQVSSRRESSGSLVAPVSMSRSTSSRMDYLGANMPSNMMSRRRSMRDAMMKIESGELELPPRKPSILHQQPPPTALLVPPATLGGLSALGAMMDSLGATAVAVAAPKKTYTPLRIDLMAVRAIPTDAESESSVPSRNSNTPPFQEISDKPVSSSQRANLDSLLSTLAQQTQQQQASKSGSTEESTENVPNSSGVEHESEPPGVFDLFASASSSEQKGQEIIPPSNQSISHESSSSSEESSSSSRSSESGEDSPWDSFGAAGGMPSLPFYINIPITFTGDGGDHMMDMFGGGHHGHHPLQGLGLFGGPAPGFPPIMHHYNPSMNGGLGTPYPPQQMPGLPVSPAVGQPGFGGLPGGVHPAFGGGLQGLRPQQQQPQGMPPGFLGANQPQTNNLLMHSALPQAHLQNMLNQQQQQPQGGRLF